MYFGINLASPGANQPEAPFLNLLRLAAPWSAGTIDANGAPTGLDTNKCVRSIPCARGLNVQHDLIISGNVRAVQIVGTSDAASTSMRAVPPNGLIQFTTSMTKLGGAIQLIVYPTGAGPFTLAVVPTKYRANFDRGELFNPDFLASLHGFNRLRFMDWCRANAFPLTDRRAQLSDDSWNPNGVPVEIQAALCNTLGVGMWTNIPHPLFGHPDVVADIISTARAKLDPGLPLFVEPSNEIWNAGFAVNAVAKAAGDAGGWGGRQAAAISKMLPPNTSIMLGSQPGGTNGIKKVVAAYTAAGGDLKRARITCAPYLSSGDRPTLSAKAAANDTAGALAMFRAQLAPQAAYLKGWGDYARSIGVPWDLYEINFAPITIPPNQAFCQALQFSQEAADIFSAHLDNCAAAGVDTAMIFNDCQSPGDAGQWGMWPWPGADPYPIGKMVAGRARAAEKQRTYDDLAGEVADLRARLEALAQKISAAAAA
jgi:hypothetical protein